MMLTVDRERCGDGDGSGVVLGLAHVDALVARTRRLDGEDAAAVDRRGRGGGKGAVLAVPNLNGHMY